MLCRSCRSVCWDVKEGIDVRANGHIGRRFSRAFNSGYRRSAFVCCKRGLTPPLYLLQETHDLLKTRLYSEVSRVRPLRAPDTVLSTPALPTHPRRPVLCQRDPILHRPLPNLACRIYSKLHRLHHDTYRHPRQLRPNGGPHRFPSPCCSPTRYLNTPQLSYRQEDSASRYHLSNCL